MLYTNTNNYQALIKINKNKPAIISKNIIIETYRLRFKVVISIIKVYRSSD